MVNLKEIIPKGDIIWSEMGQQANLAKKVYSRVSEYIPILKISVRVGVLISERLLRYWKLNFTGFESLSLMIIIAFLNFFVSIY